MSSTVPTPIISNQSAYRGFLKRYGGPLLLATILAALTLYPLTMLLYGSLSSTPPGEAGTYNLDGYRALIRWEALSILWTTVIISLSKTLIGVSIAIVLAWIVARTDTPMRALIEVLVTLPFFIPPIITALGWAMLGNPTVGTINLIWTSLTGLTEPVINVYSHGGITWHLIQYTVPFTFLLIVDNFRAMDPALEESSRMSGASGTSTFFRITLMLMLPVVSSVFLLSFIRGIEAFEAPLFFGLPAGIHLVTTEIYQAIHHNNRPDYQYATAISMAIMTLMLVLILWRARMLAGKSYVTVTGKGFSPSVIKLGKYRWVSFAFCMLVFMLFVVLPVAQLVVSSFFKYYGFYSWDMFTTQAYANVMDDPKFWRAAGNTALLAIVGATATMVIGSVTAYVVVRSKLPLRHIIDMLAWLPWLMPGIVLGLGFLWGFAFLPSWFALYGSIWALMIAYVSLGTPLAVRVMNNALVQISFDLEECSRVHGANWWQTFRRILLALTLPAFMVGWVLTFFMVLRELSASVLLYSVGNEPLSVVILQYWEDGRSSDVSVMALIMLGFVAVLRIVHLLIVQRMFAPR